MASELFNKYTDVSLIPDADGYYIAGLVDGEGHFGLHGEIYCKKPKHFATFQMGLRADDFAILKWMGTVLGCGRFRRPKTYLEDGAKRKPSAVYVCCDTGSLYRVIVPFFERFSLRAKKRLDFEIWKQGVQLLWTAGRRHRKRKYVGGGYWPTWTEDEQSTFLDLCRQLREVRKFVVKDQEQGTCE